MENTTLAGNVGNVRSNNVNTSNGQKFVLNFSLAVKTKKKDAQGKPVTKWYECALWGNYAQTMSQYIQKGSSVTVIGTTDAEIYTPQGGQPQIKHTCDVDNLFLASSGNGNNQNQNNANFQGNQNQNGNGQFQQNQQQGNFQQQGNYQQQNNQGFQQNQNQQQNQNFGMNQDDDLPY